MLNAPVELDQIVDEGGAVFSLLAQCRWETLGFPCFPAIVGWFRRHPAANDE